MAHCEEYTELISAALDGALSPTEQEKLDAHLASCPDCAALFRELSALHAALEDLPSVEPPKELKARILEQVAQEKVLPFSPPKKKGLSRRSQRWMATAAVLAIAIFGTWSWKPWERNDTAQQLAPAAADARLKLAPDKGLATGENQAAASPSSAPAEMAEAPIPEVAAQNMDPEAAVAPLNEEDVSSAPESVEESAPKATPAPVNIAPASAPEVSRSMTAGSGSSLDGSTPEFRMAKTAPTGEEQPSSESPEALDITAFQSPVLFSVPSPSPVPEENGVESSEFLLEGSGTPEEPLENPDMTPRQALDILLEAYPMPEEASLVDTGEVLGWETPPSPLDSAQESNAPQVSTRLEYVGLSSNGKYHEFWLSSFLLDDPAQGLAHSSTINFFAVPLDGGEILVQRSEETEDADAYQSGIDAYLQAVNE